MIAAYNGHAAVVELLLSKGVNIETANKVMIAKLLIEILESLFTYLLDFDDDRDKIITIFINIRIMRFVEMVWLPRNLSVLLLNQI